MALPITNKLGGKWLDSKYILTEELTGLVGGLDVKCEEKEAKRTPKV